MNFRPFKTSDYPMVLKILKAAVPEAPISEEQLRNHYENRDSSVRFERLVVVIDDEIVAYGMYEQLATSPKEFLIYGAVHHNYQHKGIGTLLYDRIITALSQFNPLLVGAYVLENKNRSIEFLKARGFQDAQQEQLKYQMVCNIASSELIPPSGIEEYLHSQGIMIKTLKELQPQENFAFKLYTLYHELIQQTPSSQPLQQKTFHEFVGDLTSLGLLAEAYNIALHQGEYIGMNALYKTPEQEVLFNEFTGVKQNYRGMGIAKTLKLRGMAYAKSHRYTTIVTHNDLRNEPIIQLNRQLGFVATIKYVKIF
jgi:mycothiol synthase